jgi:hypothetical protein
LGQSWRLTVARELRVLPFDRLGSARFLMERRVSQAFPARLSPRIHSFCREPHWPRTPLRETQEVNDLVRGVSGTTSLVDNVLDGSNAAKGDGHKIVELDPGGKG